MNKPHYGLMETITTPKPKELTKRQMLERLQFSKNLQIAIKCSQLLTGEISEQDTKGMFLDAVCRNDYKEVMMRADDHNKRALLAADCTIAKFMFIIPDKWGYVTGESYYLRIKTINGNIEVTPNAYCDGNELVYPNFRVFLYDWKIK